MDGGWLLGSVGGGTGRKRARYTLRVGRCWGLDAEVGNGG